MQFLPRHQAVDRRGHQHHHRRRPQHDRRGPPAGAAAGSRPEMCSLNMGSMNFGLFPLADRYPRMEIRLGGAVSSQHRRPHLPQHVPRHRAHHRASRQGPRHALRARVLRRRPPLQPRPFRRPQAGQAAVLRADHLRHPRRHRRRHAQPLLHEGDRRPAVRRATIAGRCWRAGRHQIPFATQAAMMGGNVRVGLEDSPLHRPRASSPPATPSRSPRSGASSRSSASRPRRRRKPARCWR